MEITISNRSRNLGYALSTVPTGHGTEIRVPTTPDVQGSLLAVERERVSYPAQMPYYVERLFVAGQPIIAVWGGMINHQSGCSHLEADEHERGFCDCQYRECWLRFSPGYGVGDVLRQLRDGERITVRTEGLD